MKDFFRKLKTIIGYRVNSTNPVKFQIDGEFMDVIKFILDNQRLVKQIDYTIDDATK